MIELPRSIKAVAASFHPSYAWKRQTPQLLPQIVETIRRARQITTFGIGRPAVNVIFATRPEQVREYLRANPGPASIDIETPGKEQPHKITIVGISCAPGSGIVFEWTDEFGDVMNELLSDPKRLKLGHNFAYDQHAFIANGIEPVMPIADTIIAEAALCPPFKEAKNMAWLSLAVSVARRVKGWPYHKEPYTERTKALYRVWFPRVPEGIYPLLYCALDAIATLLLWNEQREALNRAGMLRFFQEVLCPAAFTLCRMEMRGIPCDDEKRLRVIEESSRILADLSAKVVAYTTEKHAARVTTLNGQLTQLLGQRDAIVNAKGKPDVRNPARKALTPKIAKLRMKLEQVGPEFKPTNDNHWRWLLFAEAGLGLVPVRVSKTGVPGVKKEDIEQLQQLYPEVEILAWRVSLKTEARRRKLFTSLVPDAQGRIHFAYAIHKTENGRFSSGDDDDEDDKYRESEGGNAQNLAERDREIFVAPHGSVWIDLDMKQVELRDMAWIAGEWELVRLLLAGADIHSENGAAIFGCTPEEARKFKVWFQGREDTARQGGKKASHSWDYGAGDYKTGSLFRPWHGKPFEDVLAYLFKKADRSFNAEGLTRENYQRRLRAAQRSDDPATEEKKLRMKLVEDANTLKAREWRMAYFRKWQRLAAFQKEIVAKVEETRMLRNSFGRVLEFWNFKFNYETKRWNLVDREEALAFWPASDVGDMAKVLLPLIDACAKKWGGELVTTTHDSFSILMPDDLTMVRGFIADAKAIMERPWPQYKPHPEFGPFWVPCDVSIGKNWGKASEKNPDGLREWKEAA
jgi:DNA polymerase I-like protein with 3'-5' exonuclease and polymerase domains